MTRGSRRERFQHRWNASFRRVRGRFRARRTGAPDVFALAEGTRSTGAMVSRVGEHGEVARSLDGAGERPLALGAHARLPAGLDLGLIGEEASEEVDVLVVDLLALDARTYPPPPGEVPSARPTRATTRPSLIGRARSPLRRTRRSSLRRSRRPPLWRSRRSALIRWLSCHVIRLPRLI